MSAVMYDLVVDGKVIKSFYDREDAVNALVRLSTELASNCKIKYDRKTEAEAKCMKSRVLITDNGQTIEWKYFLGRRKLLTGSALTKAIYRILEEE